MTDPEQTPTLDDVIVPEETVHRDRHGHGKLPPRPDDEELQRLTEEERVEVGIDAYDPDEVPPATD